MENLKKTCSAKIYQAGGVAAPVGGQIFSEIFPYLEVNQENQEEIEYENEVKVPNVIGKTISDAERILKECKLELVLNLKEEINKDEFIISNQTPQSGIKVYEGNKVYVE